MRNGKLTVITCPHCGYEYLPAEIFVPTSTMGKPSNILRIGGKIEYFEGSTFDGNETYVCDNCQTKFNVTAKLTCMCEASDINKFEEETTIEIHPKKLLFDED